MINKFQKENRFLSNFWMCTVNWEAIDYPSSEHAFVAGKTLNLVRRREISFIETPGEAKQYGRQLKLRDDWDEIKNKVMYSILLCKFYQNLDLLEQLMATGSQKLVEDNTWGDTYWGVCNGVGHNYLGKLLMLIRLFNQEEWKGFNLIV